MDRAPASPGRTPPTLGGGGARGPACLDYFLRVIPVPARPRHRPAAIDGRRFRSHPRRRPSSVPSRRRIYHGRRRPVPAIVCARRASHIFFLPPPIASRSLLPVFFLRTIYPDRHLHGR